MTATEALLDRAAELAAIDALLDRLADGSGGVLTIEGPAGVGKTTILRATAVEAEERGRVVLGATGSELETAFPFGGARQLFERRLLAMDASERAAVMSGAAAQAANVVGVEPAETATTDPETVVHGLYWLAANLASEGALVLLVDDAHWLDRGTLRFLHYLARRIDELPIALIVATRSVQSTSGEASLAGLLALGQAIRPGPLSPGSIAQLVEREFGAAPDDAFLAECEAASSGNALLVTELVRALSEAGVAPTEDSADRVKAAAPEAIRRRVAAAMSGLSPRARLLAWAVAILGESDFALAGDLAGLGPGDFQTGLLALDQAGLLAPERAGRFAHPLIANAVRADMSPVARSGMHMSAARLLANAGVSSDVVAAHLLATLPAADAWVVARLREAAANALARGGPETAVAYLERALAEPPLSDDLGATLSELGSAQSRAASWADASRSLRRALGLVSARDDRLEVSIALARALVFCADFDGAVHVLEGERGGLAEDDPSAIRLDAELFRITLLDARRREMVADRRARYEAQARQGELEDPTLLVLIGTSSILACEPPELGIGLVRQAVDRIDVFGDQGDLLSWICTALTEGGEVEDAIALLEPLLAESRTHGDIAVTSRTVLFLSHACFRAGNLTDAEAHGWTGVELHQLIEGEEFFPYSLLDALIERGQAARAVELLSDMTTSGLQERDAMEMLMRGRVLAAGGDAPTALGLLLSAGRQFDALGFLHPRFAPWRGLAAPLAAELGHAGLASALADENVELGRRSQTPAAIGYALRISGAIQADADQLAEACAALEDDPDRLEHAYALTELGELHLRSGRTADARERLREALGIAHAAGATVLEERARRSLHAAGGRPRRAAMTGIDALTPSELQVARLAAEGMTNREIAQALFITLKTVERHLNRTYAKLAIPGRPGLKRALKL